jgi:hypothetical protein
MNSNQMRVGEMGRACSMYAEDEKCMQSFGWKVLREETTRKTREI